MSVEWGKPETGNRVGKPETGNLKPESGQFPCIENALADLERSLAADATEANLK